MQILFFAAEAAAGSEGDEKHLITAARGFPSRGSRGSGGAEGKKAGRDPVLLDFTGLKRYILNGRIY